MRARGVFLLRAAGAAGLALALSPGAPAAAHPGHMTEPVVVSGDLFRFEPEQVTVTINQAVAWTWEGLLFRNHSVTADPGQSEQFDSDPQGPPTNESHPPGSTFVHPFRKAGEFTYHCKVHPSMRGTVTVLGDPPPRIVGLRVSPRRACARRTQGCRKGPPVASFRVATRGDAVGRIETRSRGRWRTAKAFSRRVRPGPNAVELPVKTLRAGRYRLTLVVYDRFDRRSNIARERFALR